MDGLDSLKVLRTACGFAESGRHAAAVAFLGQRPSEQLAASPTLSLVFGTAKARQGEYDTGDHWVHLALERSRTVGDGRVEARALNVLGAIRLETGRIDDAAAFFEEALAAAGNLGDHATVGRCSNNLGIIEHLRGRLAQAIGAFTRAISAFDRVDLKRGVVEGKHNLGIAYRDQGELRRALDAADDAVRLAEQERDQGLLAQTRAGRAEICVLRGDARLARREIDAAIEAHRAVNDPVGEAEDLRILGAVYLADGEQVAAEHVLRDVLVRAERLERPLLAACAGRDLARLLARCHHPQDAAEVAASARETFATLGAERQVEQMDQLLAALDIP